MGASSGNTAKMVAPIIESHTDPVLVGDKRVLENILSKEEEFHITDYCANKDSKIAPHMRKIVTDWMSEVCEDQQCKPEVFFLSINYLDRFLSRVNIQKEQFQLCASVCLLLASKFSQVVPISTDKIVIYTDSSVTAQELRQWEIKILNVLHWELSSVTTHSFLEYLMPEILTIVSNKVDIETVRRQAETIAAMAATEYSFISAKQSLIAAAALSAALREEMESQEIIFLMKSIAVRIGSDVSEIFLYVSYMSDIIHAVRLQNEDHHILCSSYSACSDIVYKSHVIKQKAVRA